MRLLSIILISVFIPQGFQSTASAIPAEGHEIMVAGPSPFAPEIARKIHAAGGNAVDVAVAIGLSLAVTHPYYASVGGGGFAVIKIGKDVKTLDFREKAPAQAKPDLFADRDAMASRNGGLAVGVPGIVAGYFEMHKKYGKLRWSDLFVEALNLAENGFLVSGEWVETTTGSTGRFNDAGKKFFFKTPSQAYKPGERLKQPALAAFLKELKAHGPEVFYSGKVAEDLVSSVAAAGGILTTDDLKNYQARWLEPLTANFNGYKLWLMPPPSSGGVIIAEAVRLMEKLKISEVKPLSVEEFHLLVETLKLSYRGRGLLGDPDFGKNPTEQLLSNKYLSEEAALFKKNHALDVTPLENLNFEKDETTHLSVMSSNGDAVAMTVTLNGNYGSAVVSQKTGIALNNEMDDFTTKLGKPNMFGLVQGANNQVRAGARPLSSMTPTIVEKNGRTVLSIGAPGGPRITSAVLQVLYRLLTQKFNIDQAIQAPRVHHQFLPNIVKIDLLRFTPETIAALEAKGHVIDIGSTGRVAGVWLTESGILQGACDSRGECAAGGF